ncbi:AbrB/MazE/SpoVT family DNA-binding domain-containing protein [Rhizobium rhizogenes]|uniref:SpoVT-AbrB domain-containing protein n=1 Tax=Rhizobium rhizogenes NBRC 13257 TaxID=1220581 RepID=A0AA87Q3Y5_RHIRH|nr:AbrB/MazE/SpoVT family DNA-binding domain-containing protein [Rhizobium rhizogenes]NTG60136.1 AbrB family transcriptional regulator [Rhizobium rhizogenes]NTG66687.1 AbrB family transcriptional regulator [Rhizobium rhizogenes]NTG79659.1 AbrB family transcriptional regulator [Rhizobium rhizogenes]NTH95339.1 AbrB family transcriptional regulator [Rhizobium rhizogenes]NTI67550.1 AbrB family transcriptional regulator [Rhizobium rhizogenes]
MTKTKGATPHSTRATDIGTSPRLPARGQTAGGEYSTTSKLKKAGGSLVLTVPAAARDMLGLSEGQEMIVSVKGRQVIAEPVSMTAKPIKVRQPKYTLDELLEGYESDVPLSAEEKAWMDAPPIGNEVW